MRCVAPSGPRRWRTPPAGGGRRVARGWPARHVGNGAARRRNESVAEADASSGESQHQGETAPGRRRPTDRVGLLLLDELQPVLHGARKRYASARRTASSVATYPASASSVSAPSVERGSDARVLTAVYQLEELHRELDVANPARAALDLAAGQAASRHDPFGSGLHRPHRGQLVGAVVLPHTWSMAARSNPRPSSAFPATARAFSSAWNSHVAAHRAQ